MVRRDLPIRFVEQDWPNIDGPDSRFLVWENTVVVKALSLGEAFEKITLIGEGHCLPYKGGKEAIDVQWIYEGIIELLPIYEEIDDGSEIMWAERRSKKLKNIQAIALAKEDVFQ